MNETQSYRGLRFETRPRSAPRRLIAIGISIGIFILLWLVISPNVLFWILLPLIGCVVWVASYGWRRALAAIHDLLHQLEGH
jgi:hypothetical protein